MLVRDLKRLALLVGPLFALLLISFSLWNSDSDWQSHVSSFLGNTLPPDNDQAYVQDPQSPPSTNTSPSSPPSTSQSGTNTHSELSFELPADDAGNGTHHEIFSLSTADKKYFPIKFGNESAFNPNIIPHPTRGNTWIIVAQKVQNKEKDPYFEFFEIGCDAAFVDGVLQCLDEAPAYLPVAHTTGNEGKCEGDFEPLSMNKGPHDARVLYGPKKPYLMFGSNSAFNCFGEWLQDFRRLVNWGAELPSPDDFVNGTELQRPPPYGTVEKNWFMFWDSDEVAYVHYDTTPARVFAKLNPNGSVGKDLGPFAAEQDEKCIAHYLPKLPEKLESIHQASNSLRITMCKRADKTCKPDATNTFIMTIIQHKTYYDYHSEYEPYVMLFRDRSPFEVFAISKKPLWIHGRERVGNRTDMLYIVSASWKSQSQKYDGYLDDELFLAFGIEDQRSGGIDILASDLLGGLGLCNDV